jgi:Zn-dependent protease with chaperone function
LLWVERLFYNLLALLIWVISIALCLFLSLEFAGTIMLRITPFLLFVLLLLMLFNYTIVVSITGCKLIDISFRTEFVDNRSKLQSAWRKAFKKSGFVSSPRIFWVDSQSANAFTFGFGMPFLLGMPVLGAGIAVTSTLVERLPEEELVAVLLHECGHIQSKDIAFASGMFILNQVTTRITRFLGFFRWGLIIPIYFLIGVAIPLAEAVFSRNRELAADIWASVKLGSSDPLVSALLKLSSSTSVKDGEVKGLGIFSSHPNLDQRTENLKIWK